MRAKRILDEMLAKGQSLPNALILCWIEKNGINPVATVVQADRRRRLVRWLTFPFLVVFLMGTTAMMTERFRDDIMTRREAFSEALFWAVLICILIRLGLPYVFTINYCCEGEEMFFDQLDEVKQYIAPFSNGECWHDKFEARKQAERLFFMQAESIKTARVRHGELSEEAREAEAAMKKVYTLFEFYNLLPQFKDAKEAYAAAFDATNQQPIRDEAESSTASV